MRSAICLTAFVALALLLGCAKPPAPRAETPPAPVIVTTAGKKTVPVELRSIGTVKVLSTVAIRPRVGGHLTGVFFKEGDEIDEKQKLFTIDPRPYYAAIKQAEANKAKSVTLLEGAKLTLRRAEQAKTGGVGAAAEYEAALTAVASAQAAIDADEAAVNTATIQAGFATVVSPIKGRAGELLVTRGNLVDANSATPLVVVNQMSPISVTFSLPEYHLPVVRAAQRSRGPLKVEASVRGIKEPVVGKLVFVDNAADPQTGTVQFKATFDNPDSVLWPGRFVDVVLTLGTRPDSVVVPSAALQSGQKGQYVYAVTADKKAQLKEVKVAFEIRDEAAGESGRGGGEMLAVIEDGLTGGETVVLEGQLRLAPGTKVEPKPRPARPAPSVPQVITGGAQ
jgi:multidrug efflux system membrane fusion protein